ncbi:hypothetical protein JD82_03565 [Prauserella rugosa]|uniref:Uncharacterized protein n=1 Tax=Prauserella rugosa TaxID=43354 RepID=A0A660CJB8_9PSEU|nr:hypothetical protein JD82_03565 [Prauserella rugosa]
MNHPSPYSGARSEADSRPRGAHRPLCTGSAGRPSSYSAPQREKRSSTLPRTVVHRMSTASTGLSAPCPQDVHEGPDRNAALQRAARPRTCAPLACNDVPSVWKSLCAKKSFTPAGDLGHEARVYVLGTTLPTTGDNLGDNCGRVEDGRIHSQPAPNRPPVAAPCAPHAAAPADLRERAVSTQLTTLTTTAGQKISLRRTKEKEGTRRAGDEGASRRPGRYDGPTAHALPWRPTHPVRSGSGLSPCRCVVMSTRCKLADPLLARSGVPLRSRGGKPGRALSSFELRRLGRRKDGRHEDPRRA